MTRRLAELHLHVTCLSKHQLAPTRRRTATGNGLIWETIDHTAQASIYHYRNDSHTPPLRPFAALKSTSDGRSF